MTVSSHAAPAWTLLIPLVFLGLAVARSARARNLKVERLWIAPALILVATALTFSQQRLPGIAMLVGDVVALAAGALAGWWRGRLTHISVDPQTHALTSRASPLGMLLIVAVFGLRYILRAYSGQSANLLHVSAVELADALMLFAVGLVCVQRLEMALRASRLLAEARATP
jgi:hypothetical protein